MPSRLATAASRSHWLLSAFRNQPPQSRIAAAAASTTGRTADPAVYSGEVKAGPDVDYPETHGAVQYDPKSDDTEHGLNQKSETDLLVKPKASLTSSPRLESAGVINPARESSRFQQKRKVSSAVLDSVSCVGIDGTPVKEEREKQSRSGEEDKEYFGHHKASPLSEIKFADTRKPITRATDGTITSSLPKYGGGEDVMGWRPEQLETAEETLQRATEIWRQNAMRGDPETYPQSRVLRELLGEWF